MTTNKTLHILVVDDDLPIRHFLLRVLGDEFHLSHAGEGHAGLATVAAAAPDLILLDLVLPDLDGIEVIKRVREWSQVPIIVISELDQEADKVAALNAGADDYLTKPFGAGELKARIGAVLRRSLQQAPEPVFVSGDLTVNLPERRILLRGEEISLTPTEYDILRLLVVHAGKVLTHRQILKQVWGINFLKQPHVLRVNISNLRHKIEEDSSKPRHIVTEPGVGYRLVTAGPH